MTEPLKAMLTSQSLRRWLLFWAALTIGSITLHEFMQSQQAAQTWHVFRLLNNAALLLTLPGWVCARIMTRAVGTPTTHFIAAPLGWGIAVVSAASLFRARRALVPGSSDVPYTSRRRFLVDATAAAFVLPPAGFAYAAIAHEPWSLRVARSRLTISGFGRDLGEFRIVNVTDTHLGTRVPSSFVERAYELAISLEPDFALFTGDFLYNDATLIEKAAELASGFAASAKIASFGVLGNHDWYLDGLRMRDALSDAGITMLDNSQRLVDLGDRTLTETPSPTTLRFAGLGDLQTDDTRPEPALLGPARRLPTILLAHQPDTAEHAGVLGAVRSGARVDLQLSGHTHGGQVRVPFLGTPIIPSRYGQKYAHGLVQGPGFPVLVSAGVGMSILPVRWGVPPEIVLLTIDCRA